MEKHRPGPWGLMAGMPTNVLDNGGLRVARCDYDGDFDATSAHANARLIAAAPDLLAALQAMNACLSIPSSHLQWTEANAFACAAIAKATGSPAVPAVGAA